MYACGVPSPLLPVQIIAAAGALCAALAAWHALWVRARWARAGRAVHLEDRYPLHGTPSLNGTIDGVPISVIGDVASAARATSRSVPYGLSFTPIPFSGPLIEATGDRDFDRATRAACGERPDVLAAILDESTRDLLAEFASQGGVVQLGAAEISATRPETAKTIALSARRVAHVAASLSRPLDVPAALSHNALHDPVDGVRENCLRLLIERHAGEIAMTTCRAAARDASPSVRLVAGVFLREAGLTCLLELVSAKIPADIAKKAIAHAVAVHTPATAAEVRTVIRAGFAAPALLAQAIHSAAKIHWWEGIEPLLDECSAFDTETLISLAAGLARFPERIAVSEPHLVAMLQSSVNARRAAAKTLGEIGTVAAVAPLLPMSQVVLGDSETRAAALSAIRAIQARQAGAGAGQLTLGDAAVSEEGKLALVTEGGELAIANSAGSLALAHTKKTNA